MKKRKTEQVADQQCPYLDTVDRRRLEFDAEKICSVTLARKNVYMCLICSKYLLGKGVGTPAYQHGLTGHHIFLHLENKKIFCLPDGYQVNDVSLHDIVNNVDPVIPPDLPRSLSTCVSLEGLSFNPGVVGVNNLHHNNAINCILLLLASVSPFREFFLYQKDLKNPLLAQLSLFVRKVWNTQSFRGHVSPHEILQAIGAVAPSHVFRSGVESDPMVVLPWILDTIDRSLRQETTGKKKRTIVDKYLKGKLVVTTETDSRTEQEKEEGRDATMVQTNQTVNFRFLSLDLPPVPLFIGEDNLMPQIPLQTLLSKFDGVTWSEYPSLGKRNQYTIKRLPPVLIVNIQRKTKTRFSEENNPTVTPFPMTNLNLSHLIEDSKTKQLFDLVACIKAESDGSYAICVPYGDGWKEINDLIVSEIHPEKIAISEACLLVYQRKK